MVYKQLKVHIYKNVNLYFFKCSGYNYIMYKNAIFQYEEETVKYLFLMFILFSTTMSTSEPWFDMPLSRSPLYLLISLTIKFVYMSKSFLELCR